MDSLKDTKVFRCGSSETYLREENSNCTFSINSNFQKLKFNFSLPVPGGTTDVCLEIGKNDLPNILKIIANEGLVDIGVFIDCTQTASEQVLKKLEEKDKEIQRREKIKEGVIAELKVIDSFIYKKYKEVPDGKDLLENEMNHRMDNILQQLGCRDFISKTK